MGGDFGRRAMVGTADGDGLPLRGASFGSRGSGDWPRDTVLLIDEMRDLTLPIVRVMKVRDLAVRDFMLLDSRFVIERTK